MQSIRFQFLSVSLFAIIISLGAPSFAQAQNEDGAYEASNVGGNAEAGSDADYTENENPKAGSYKHYIVDKNGHATAVLSSDAPPESIAQEVNEDVQAEDSVQQPVKKRAGNRSVQKTKPVPTAPVATLQPKPIEKPHVEEAVVEPKIAKPEPVVVHTESKLSPKAAELDKKTKAKLAKLRLFRHRIKRTDEDKLSVSSNSTAVDGQ